VIFDLLMLNSVADAVLTTPADLFKPGDKGAWYDGSDLTTMFQDSAGTIPVTGSGQPIGRWNNKIAGQEAGFNLTQSFSANRPTTTLSNGKLVVNYDGLTQTLFGVNSTAGYSELTMAVGQIKTSTETKRMLDLNTSTTACFLQNSSAGTVVAQVLNRQVTSTQMTSTSSPNTIVAYGSPTVVATIRINGVATTSSVTAATVEQIQVYLVPEETNDCKISQAFFINRVLTLPEITFLESYIASKQ